MSHTYNPANVSDAELREELARLQQALNSAQPDFTYVVQHAEPIRYWSGMTVYADGSDWDPGSGEGLYRRNVANNAWVFIG